MYGPSGFGTQGFVVLNQIFPYRVDFENEPTATAPAQRVDITDQLDPNLDWTTFQLTQVGFGDTIINIPAGSQYFATTVPITENGQSFDVDIELGLNTATGQVYAHFLSINPNTQLPPDVLTGFLPPEDGTGRGMGFFSYTIDPKAGLPTGTQIRNVALVSFDLQQTIATDQVNDQDPTKGIDPTKQALVTIDSGPPTSSVSPLPPTESTASFTVSWSGQDDPGGSGVAFYNIYESEDGGPYALWQADTTQTSTTFTGDYGQTYSFYSVATDNVGNVEATQAAAEATTQILALGTTTSVQSSENPAQFGDSLTFTATVAANTAGAPTPTGSVQFLIDGADLGAPVSLVDGIATSASISNLSIANHVVTAQYQSDDVAFNSGQGTLSGGETVNPASVSVLVASSAPESHYGQGVTFTATIEVTTAGRPAPAGTVQFAAGGTPFGGPVNVVSGTAVSISTTTLPAGSDSITAVYSGDPNFAGNTGSFSQTIGQAPLTVTADDQTMVYGSSVPSLTYSITGFVNGDTMSVVSGSPSLTTPATSASGVGGYPIAITAGSLAAANYDFPDLANGTLTINPAPLTVTADDQIMVYGAPVPSLTYSITGFVNGDTAGVVSGTPGLSTPAMSSSNVGNYPIAVSVAELSATNYSFTGQSGTLTIEKAHLTVTVKPESKLYGAAVPSLGYTITGFANGQSASVVSGTPVLSTTGKSSSGVGSDPITVTAGSLAAANYDFTNLVPNTLLVTPAPLTIAANDVSRLVGQPNPLFSVSYTGFVNGDGPSSLQSPPKLSTSATTSSPAGVYPITVSGAASANYTITFIAGTLTVIPPLVTMTGVVDKTNK